MHDATSGEGEVAVVDRVNVDIGFVIVRNKCSLRGVLSYELILAL